jgi:ABC-type multidrug transport system fused ATPase/permease subunit
LLKNPKILILDEATSALDAQSEQIVQVTTSVQLQNNTTFIDCSFYSFQDTINTVIKNRTVFVVAHRLSTIKHADLIVVVERGKIIESGKHDDLMKLKGHYYNLFKIQMNSKA